MPISLKRDRIVGLDPKYDLKPKVVELPKRELPVKPAPAPDVAALVRELLDQNRAGMLALLQAAKPASSMDWEFVPTRDAKGIASVDCIKEGRIACTFVVHRDKAGKLEKLTMKGRG